MTRPYEFTGPYAGCYTNRVMCVDERHVFTIHEMLRSGLFKSALEIGSYRGASSTAFVNFDALDTAPKVTFCELRITESLMNVVRRACSIGFAEVLQQDSVKVLSSAREFDFIFVDGNHDMESVSRELVHLIRRKPLCIMAHDTNASAAGYQKAEGALHLKQTLSAHPAYAGRCIEDNLIRLGEETHRGMFLATTSDEVFEVARAAFAKWCPQQQLQEVAA